MVQKVCPDCNGVFEYFPNPNFPDKRKYCDNCSAVRKAQWEQKQGKPAQKLVEAPKPQPVVKTEGGAVIGGSMVTTQIQIVRNERPNSYEFGKAGNRFKIYFEDLDDLQDKIDSLMSLRIPPELSGLD